MFVRVTSLLAALALAAACNAGKTEEKASGKGKKDAADGKVDGKTAPGKAKIASQIKSKGFALVGDEDGELRAEDIEEILDLSENGCCDAEEVTEPKKDDPADQPKKDDVIIPDEPGKDQGVTWPVGPGGDDMPPPPPGADGEEEWDGEKPKDGKWRKKNGWHKPRISHWTVTVLDGDNSPIVGAMLHVKKMKFKGKKGFQKLDQIELENPRSNVFHVFIQSGREYALVVNSKKAGTAIKQISFDSRKPVKVSFPIIVDSAKWDEGAEDWGGGKTPGDWDGPGGGGGKGGTGGYPGKGEEGEGGGMLPPGEDLEVPAWSWCNDVGGKDKAEMQAMMEEKMAKLKAMMACKMPEKWSQIEGDLDKWSGKKKWRMARFACEGMRMKMWAMADGDDGKEKKLRVNVDNIEPLLALDPKSDKMNCEPMTDLPPAPPAAPAMPDEPSTEKAKEKDAPKPLPAPAPEAPDAPKGGRGLLGCDRGPNSPDIYHMMEMAFDSKLTEVGQWLKKHYVAKMELDACSASYPNVKMTVKVETKEFDGSAFENFWE